MAVASFFLCSPDCPKQPRTSFPFYKFFYPTISGRISGCSVQWQRTTMHVHLLHICIGVFPLQQILHVMLMYSFEVEKFQVHVQSQTFESGYNQMVLVRFAHKQHQYNMTHSFAVLLQYPLLVILPQHYFSDFLTQHQWVSIPTNPFLLLT